MSKDQSEVAKSEPIEYEVIEHEGVEYFRLLLRDGSVNFPSARSISVPVSEIETAIKRHRKLPKLQLESSEV